MKCDGWPKTHNSADQDSQRMHRWIKGLEVKQWQRPEVTLKGRAQWPIRIMDGFEERAKGCERKEGSFASIWCQSLGRAVSLHDTRGAPANLAAKISLVGVQYAHHVQVGS